MSLRRLLGSLVIFTTKQKRCQVLHAINAHFSLILIEPLVNQLEISTCRHLAHLDIYSHYILFLVTVLQLLVLGTPKPLSSCWVCRPRQPLQQTIVLMYMVDFFATRGERQQGGKMTMQRLLWPVWQIFALKGTDQSWHWKTWSYCGSFCCLRFPQESLWRQHDISENTRCFQTAFLGLHIKKTKVHTTRNTVSLQEAQYLQISVIIYY